MAKKSRKTRKDKQAPRKHEFNPWVTSKAPAKSEKSENVTEDRNKPQIPAYVYADFKKITLIMAGFVAGVVILALLSYHTDIFDPFFKIFNIKY